MMPHLFIMRQDFRDTNTVRQPGSRYSSNDDVADGEINTVFCTCDNSFEYRRKLEEMLIPAMKCRSVERTLSLDYFCCCEQVVKE